MKIFGGDMITNVYNTLGADENLPIQVKLLSKAVESAQKKVENRNFTIRKNVLQYDDVMNTQREIIYKQRREVLDGNNIKENISKMIDTVAENLVNLYATEDGVNKEALLPDISTTFGFNDISSLDDKKLNIDKITEEIKEKAHKKYEEKEEIFGEKVLRELERVVMLKIVDERWMDHIDSMDELKDGIGLRAYGQKDPVVQYRIEGFDMFDQMVSDIQLNVVKILMNTRKREGAPTRQETVKITGEGFEDINSPLKPQQPAAEKNHTPIVNNEPKVGRNDPCPCGSGKKYKNCCGKNA